jgi:hypothetical protein
MLNGGAPQTLNATLNNLINNTTNKIDDHVKAKSATNKAYMLGQNT